MLNKFKNKIETAKKELFDSCVRFGLKDGQRDYTRFIILGRGRSGSTWLATLLRTNEHVRCFGEMFNAKKLSKNSMGWDVPGYRTKACQLERLQTEPVAFLQDEVFAPMPAHIEAVGFKLFYYHAKSENLAPIWDYLQGTNLKVIHLRRRNLLASCLSTVAAADTGSYRFNKMSESNFKTYNISYDTCLTFFESTRIFEEKFSEFFPDILEVFYENLKSDCDFQMHEIQKFIGVSPKKLRSSLKQQNLVPLKQRIENYDDLKNRFYGTPYECFFE